MAAGVELYVQRALCHPVVLAGATEGSSPHVVPLAQIGDQVGPSRALPTTPVLAPTKETVPAVVAPASWEATIDNPVIPAVSTATDETIRMHRSLIGCPFHPSTMLSI